MILLGDTYRLAMVGRLTSGQQWVTTMAYIQNENTLVPGAQALAEAFAAGPATVLMALLPTDYAMDVVEVRQLNAPGTEGFDEPVTLLGSDPIEALPPMNCTIVSKRTGLVGRRFRGRMYLPAPSEGQQNGGALLGTYVANVQAWAETILVVDAIDGSLAQYTARIWHDDLGTGTNLTNVLVRTLLGTQRRRRAGVGS
jgi:hypothetical protein